MYRLGIDALGRFSTIFVGAFFCVTGWQFFAGAEIHASFFKGELTPRLVGAVAYSSNIAENQESEEDFVFQVSPGVVYTTVGSVVRTELEAAVSVSRFAENNENDSEDYQLQLGFSAPHGIRRSRYTAAIQGGVSESTSPNSEFQEITSSRRFFASIDGSYEFIPRYSIGTGLSFDFSEGLSEGQSDTVSFSVPLNVRYTYSESLALRTGYRFREQSSENSDGDFVSRDHAFFVGAVGDITPLITGRANGGFQFREVEGGDEASPYASVSLSWAPDRFNQISIELGSDFSTTVGNQSRLGYVVGIGYNRNIGESLAASLRYRWSQDVFAADVGNGGEEDRVDIRNTVSSGLSWKINNGLSAGAQVYFSDFSSTEESFEFSEAGFRLRLGFSI